MKTTFTRRITFTVEVELPAVEFADEITSREWDDAGYKASNDAWKIVSDCLDTCETPITLEFFDADEATFDRAPVVRPTYSHDKPTRTAWFDWNGRKWTANRQCMIRHDSVVPPIDVSIHDHNWFPVTVEMVPETIRSILTTWSLDPEYVTLDYRAYQAVFKDLLMQGDVYRQGKTSGEVGMVIKGGEPIAFIMPADAESAHQITPKLFYRYGAPE